MNLLTNYITENKKDLQKKKPHHNKSLPAVLYCVLVVMYYADAERKKKASRSLSETWQLAVITEKKKNIHAADKDVKTTKLQSFTF